MTKILCQEVDRYQRKCPTIFIADVQDDSMLVMSKNAVHLWRNDVDWDELVMTTNHMVDSTSLCLFSEEVDYIFTVVG